MCSAETRKGQNLMGIVAMAGTRARASRVPNRCQKMLKSAEIMGLERKDKEGTECHPTR